MRIKNRETLKYKKTEILQLIKENVTQTDPNAEVYLFGSRARGEAREDSDWDLLVLTNYPVNFKISGKFMDNLCDVELEIEEALSTFVYYKKKWNTKHKVTPFYESVVNDYIRL